MRIFIFYFLGDLVPICSWSDPKINECAKNSAQKLLPLMASGMDYVGATIWYF